jgi:hypothetical protein
MRYILLLMLLTGCSGSVSTKAPSAANALVMAKAENAAIRSLPILLPTQPAWLNVAYYKGSPFLIAAFEQSLWQHGVPLVDQADASIVIVPYIAVDGVEDKSFYLGTPPIPITGILSFPSISVYSKTTTIGVAEFRYFAYDKRTNKFIGSAKSKFGFAPYSVTESLLLGERDFPRIPDALRVR